MEARGGLYGLHLNVKATPPRSLATMQRTGWRWRANGVMARCWRAGWRRHAQCCAYMALPPTEVVGPVRRLEAGSEWRAADVMPR